MRVLAVVLLTFLFGSVALSRAFAVDAAASADVGAPPKFASAELPGHVSISFAGQTMEFALIPAGSFIMGSDENTGGGDESPQHRVTFTRPFYLGVYEVTQEQWQAVMGNNPSGFRGEKRPVESISWNDGRRFLKKLGDLTGHVFALPSEAQWEYACRAGTSTLWSFGNDEKNIGEYAWFADNSGGTTHPVGQKKPNPWGLYDMHGNVGEWCSDYYAKHTYSRGDVTDPAPVAPYPKSSPIWRGGAWGDNPDFLRCAYRNVNGADEGHHGIGLRCLMEISGSPSTGVHPESVGKTAR